MKGKTKVKAGANDGAVRVKLGTAQTIREVAHLREELDGVLAGASRIELDVRSLERVDTACLQLLTAFHRDATARGINIVWLEPAPELLRVTHLLGLAQVLHLQAKG